MPDCTPEPDERAMEKARDAARAKAFTRYRDGYDPYDEALKGWDEGFETGYRAASAAHAERERALTEERDNAINDLAESMVDPTAKALRVEKVAAAAIREGDYIWFDVTKEFKPVVAVEQGGYSEITFHLDDGPDEALETRWQRGETVLRALAVPVDTEENEDA